jgi:hypothetical protein
MGLPIPFENFGKIIPELYIKYADLIEGYVWEDENLGLFFTFLMHNMVNLD